MIAAIGIGIPGSGKTTLLKPLAEKNGLEYINADDIREELTGDSTDHTREEEVWELVYERVRKGLANKGIVVDATHSRRKDREKIAAFCRANGAKKVVAIWIDTPFYIAMKRNVERRRIVPIDVIHKMYDRLEASPPAKEEGFDSVIKR